MVSIFKSFPEINLGDIVLRELQDEDVIPLWEYVADPKVNRYIADDGIPKNFEEAKEELAYWKNLFIYHRSVYWAITYKKNNKLIGTCGFNVWSRVHRRVEISYDLSRKEWGKGVMTRSIQAICDYAFSAMDVNRIQATVVMENIPSIKLLDRLGFKQEGMLREYGILHGKKHDSFMYSLLPNDIVIL